MKKIKKYIKIIPISVAFVLANVAIAVSAISVNACSLAVFDEPQLPKELQK